MPRKRPISAARLVRDPVARVARLAELAIELRQPGLGRNEIAARVEERQVITQIARIDEEERDIAAHLELAEEVRQQNAERERLSWHYTPPEVPYRPSAWTPEVVEELRLASEQGRLFIHPQRSHDQEHDADE